MKIWKLLIALVLFSSCQRYYPTDHAAQRRVDANYYARKHYVEEEMRKAEMDDDDTFTLGMAESELTVNIDDEDVPQGWIRLPYETVDDWVSRVVSILERNHYFIEDLQAALSRVESQESTAVAKLHHLIQQNESLRGEISDFGTPEREKAVEDGSFAHDDTVVRTPYTTPANFKIHMVRSGETLYSLALKYYSRSERTRDLILWNQGWIRSPEELLAGSALILFPDNAPEKTQQVVDLYIENLERHQ